MASIESKVYRLRSIPDHLDRLGVAELISTFIPHGDQRDVIVSSLALSCELWVRPRTKTATLSFRKLPKAVGDGPKAGEWSLWQPGLPQPLLLDDKFYGLTPLNEVPEHQDKYECIVMSGLASHPMGSWQPHGKDKSFMWVRDTLPNLVKGVKFILYGGWAAPGPKNLSFFAHSLGGVVLKEAFRMVADSGVMAEPILNRTRGVVFFGVPSQGLDVSDLQIMLGDQPNKDALVKEISCEGSFLETLEEQFLGISQLRKMSLLWAFETEITPTVQAVDGGYQRSGPGTVFVSPESATGNRCESDSASTIQINANHSDMVKFSRGNELIDRIAYKLQLMLQDTWVEASQEASAAIDQMAVLPEDSQQVEILMDHADPAADLDFWNIYSIIESIRAPERDARLEQIDAAAGYSFQWALEDSSIGLTNWLQNGDKVFWVSGKPASGKSTFINNFFFHHRGTAMQKSLDGLLRSILSQVLEQAPKSNLLFQKKLEQLYNDAIAAAKLESLSLDLESLIRFSKIRMDSEVETIIKHVLACEIPRKLFRTMVVEQMPSMTGIRNILDLERRVYPHLHELQAAFNTGNLDRVDSLVSKINDDWKQTSRFESLLSKCLREWLGAIDFKTQLRKLKETLMNRIERPESNGVKKGKLQLEVIERRVNQLTEKILDRFSARQRQQYLIETAQWSVLQLERAVDDLVKQRLIDIDICLFIDALDEHDGPPEFISHFVKDLISNQGSRTRIKILFSSRRWDTFVEAFDQYPGLQIHDFTENDIREICVRTIGSNIPGSDDILKMTDEIVERARGVFLWVKLVLNDLSQCAAKFLATRKDREHLPSELLKAMELLPNDLSQYYETIIERLPYSSRWEAFCLLEVVSKSTEPIFLHDVSKILACSNVKKRADIEEAAMPQRNRAANKYTEGQLRTHSGGLVEVVPFRGKFQLQLLHQTAAEFVQRPDFKNIVLGEKCRLTEDNGHSLMVKFLFPSKAGDFYPISDRLLLHARAAEATTGKSQYSLFEGTTWIWDKNVVREQFLPRVREGVSWVELAIYAQLHLLLKDMLQDNGTFFSESPPRALVFFLHSISKGLSTVSDASHLLGLLVENDFEVQADLHALLYYFYHDEYINQRSAESKLRSNNAQYELDDRNQSTILPIQETPEPFVTDVITRYFGTELSFSISTLGGDELFDQITRTRQISLSKAIDYHGQNGSVRFLHICTASIANDMLRSGAKPNVLSSGHQTPLDYRVKYRRSFPNQSDNLLAIAFLVKGGGHLNMCTKGEWKRFLNEDLPSTLPNYRAMVPFPGWVDGAPGLRYLGKKLENLFKDIVKVKGMR
ncbi:hypothetical protein PT974_10915 [Cladobotryum mycophilum]|uniref:Nephrocystin 3-like N-terminal domain-containing protein n=1 Tax=Cladobotryum mycophilum TaxID=491253 RepID=A0ABR0SB52_9HYPO